MSNKFLGGHTDAERGDRSGQRCDNIRELAALTIHVWQLDELRSRGTDPGDAERGHLQSVRSVARRKAAIAKNMADADIAQAQELATDSWNSAGGIVAVALRTVNRW